MDLEKRVAAIEQKLGISMDSASTNMSPSTDVSPVPSTDVSPVPSTDVSPVPSTDVSPVPSTDVSPVPSTDVSHVPSTDVSPVPSTDVSPVPSTDVSPVPSIIPSTDVSPVPSIIPSISLPESTIISLNGYNGTLKDLFSKIRSKISDLDRAANKGRYSSRVTELKTLLVNLTKATTVQDIQSTIGTKLKFKNDNSLMGGKSKRRSRKSKKSNKSKRR